MATIPTMITWTDDQLVTPELMNEQVRDMGNFAVRRPGAYVKKNGSFTADAGAIIRPTFDTVLYDTDGMVSFTALPNGLTVQTPGLYLVSAQYDVKVPTATSARGTVYANVLPSNADCCRMQETQDWATNPVVGSLTGVAYLNAGDQVAWQAFVAGMTGQTATCGTVTPCSLSALWIGS